jgi:chromosomal replication initiator protein
MPAPAAGKSRPFELHGFTVLPENRSAVRAISALARSVLLGKRSRVCPLLLHGQHGTGKTRLTNSVLSAIAVGSRTATGRSIPARELARANDDLRFADPELATCDFLVLEDVQHLPKSASDALCELIDRRQSRRRALVITANTGPALLQHLPRRLTSRLASGLVVQLEPLGPRSRRAILESNANKVQLAPDALDWLAAQGGGLRAALGLLQSLGQAAAAHPRPLDRQAVEEILAGTGQPTSREADLKVIIKHVCVAFGATQKDLLGKSRLRPVLVPRQVAMYLAHTVGKLSLPRIGGEFGRDHTTVLHACRKIDELMKTDPKLHAIVRQLTKQLM